MSLNGMVFHTSGGILLTPVDFLFLILLSSESSSSRLNGPILMSNCFLILLVIGSCVTFGGFPCRFWKCCFHNFIRSCWFVAFSLALAVLSFWLTSFIVCHAILDCLSSSESQNLSIWFCMYSVLLSICWLIYIYIYIYIYINKIWHLITYNGWYAIKPNHPKLRKFAIAFCLLFDIAYMTPSSTFFRQAVYWW